MALPAEVGPAGREGVGRAGGPGLSINPGPPGFLLLTGVLDDACEVVVSEVESVVGQLQRSPCGLLAAEVADLAGYVIGQRPCAVPAREVVYRQQVEPGVEGARWRVGAALPRCGGRIRARRRCWPPRSVAGRSRTGRSGTFRSRSRPCSGCAVMRGGWVSGRRQCRSASPRGRGSRRSPRRSPGIRG